MVRGTITWSDSERWAKPRPSARRAIVSMPCRVASGPRVGMVKPTSMMLSPQMVAVARRHANGSATAVSSRASGRPPGDGGCRGPPACGADLLRADPEQGVLHDRREAEEKAHGAQAPRQ